MEGGPGEGNKGGSSVQFSHSVVSEPVTPRTVARQASLSFTISQSFLRLLSIESMMPSNHLTLWNKALRIVSSRGSRSTWEDTGLDCSGWEDGALWGDGGILPVGWPQV